MHAHWYGLPFSSLAIMLLAMQGCTLVANIHFHYFRIGVRVPAEAGAFHLSLTASIYVIGHTHPPIQWALEALCRGKGEWSWPLTSIERLHPPICLYGVVHKYKQLSNFIVINFKIFQMLLIILLSTVITYRILPHDNGIVCRVVKLPIDGSETFSRCSSRNGERKRLLCCALASLSALKFTCRDLNS